VGFDDRAAYGQAHPHAVGLSRKKRIENAIEIFAVDSRSRIPHRQADAVRVFNGGSLAGAQARVIDFDETESNDWLAVNQFTVSEGQHTRRADVVLFVNGLPLAVVELKNAADENADVWSAFRQLQTYQAQIPALFATNAVLVASDGAQARVGSIGAGREWFKPWRTVAGGDDAMGLPELQVVLQGVFDKRRFLDLMRYFVVFEDAGAGKLTKKIAGYHQFHAVNVALEETIRAALPDRVGRQVGIESDQCLPQATLQNDVAIIRIAALCSLLAQRDRRAT
jgi:type I site-specific restriction-modification system R (restriction) subunit